jgi:hypothetical protein
VSVFTSIITNVATNGSGICVAAKALVGSGKTDIVIPALVALANNPEAECSHRNDAAEYLAELGMVDEAIAGMASIASDPSVRDYHRKLAQRNLESLRTMR